MHAWGDRPVDGSPPEGGEILHLLQGGPMHAWGCLPVDRSPPAGRTHRPRGRVLGLRGQWAAAGRAAKAPGVSKLTPIVK